jgi:tRNA U54 and U55 pseudouridine synthase Pus10
MLGKGRPFVLELINPNKLNLSTQNDILTTAMNKINGDSSLLLTVTNLSRISKSIYSKLKDGDQTKNKIYRQVIKIT